MPQRVKSVITPATFYPEPWQNRLRPTSEGYYSGVAPWQDQLPIEDSYPESGIIPIEPEPSAPLSYSAGYLPVPIQVRGAPGPVLKEPTEPVFPEGYVETEGTPITPKEPITAWTQEEQRAWEAKQRKPEDTRALGNMTFATGLDMLARASTMPQYGGMLGGMGVAIAGMAQMANKGGRWALPVSVIGTLAFLQAERQGAAEQATRSRRFAQAYGRAIANAGALYGR